jgi:hypothetical protein
MNRRELMQRLAVLSINVAIRGGHKEPGRRNIMQKPARQLSGTEPLPSVVAGVRLVDSTIARIAIDLSRTASP